MHNIDIIYVLSWIIEKFSPSQLAIVKFSCSHCTKKAMKPKHCYWLGLAKVQCTRDDKHYCINQVKNTLDIVSQVS